jgi:hypothetical protein
MKNKSFKTMGQLFVALGFAIGVASCGGGGNANNSGNNPGGNGRGGAATSQVDRLARPAINEGLSINDATLNAFNSVPPSADLSNAAKPVRDEAIKTLQAFGALGQKLGTTAAPDPAVIAGAFLPDVMRIDTRLNIPVGATAYNAATSGDKGILTGGRKIEDDAMDITLSFLVAGDATGQTVKDNVFYEGVQGNPNQPGHQLLNGQQARRGAATFPFVTTPN